MDHLGEAIDLYCERLDAGFWAEPVNALSNLAFVAAGLLGLALARREGAGRFAVVLGWWAIAVGLGSFLFHTIATRLTMWADILPIAGFTLAYTLFILRRWLGFGWPQTLIVFIAFYAVAGILTLLVPESLRIASNGSTGYLAPFLALCVFGFWLLSAGSPAGRYVLGAAAVFVAAVIFRALDPVVCATVPLGTHFLWHTLNGVMLAILLVAAARVPARRA